MNNAPRYNTHEIALKVRKTKKGNISLPAISCIGLFAVFAVVAAGNRGDQNTLPQSVPDSGSETQQVSDTPANTYSCKLDSSTFDDVKDAAECAEMQSWWGQKKQEHWNQSAPEILDALKDGQDAQLHQEDMVRLRDNIHKILH